MNNSNSISLKKHLQDTDFQLLQQIQADNMLALDELYKRYQKRLFHFANYILKSSADSENIVQEVFLKLWENRHRIEKVKPYIFSIAYNSTISQIRKKIREQAFIDHVKSLPETWEDPVNIDLEYRELKEKAETIIHELPDRQKEVYLLSRQDGLSYREIAKKMDISVNTVENHLVKALKTIRKELGNVSLVGLLFAYLFV